MGVKHSKQSVDISSTPIKAGVPVEEVNGKTAEDKTEKVETITKVNIQSHAGLRNVLLLIRLVYDLLNDFRLLSYVFNS